MEDGWVTQESLKEHVSITTRAQLGAVARLLPSLPPAEEVLLEASAAKLRIRDKTDTAAMMATKTRVQFVSLTVQQLLFSLLCPLSFLLREKILTIRCLIPPLPVVISSGYW